MRQLAIFCVLLGLIYSPASAQSSIPAPSLLEADRTPMSSENLYQVTQLATWGNGQVYDVAWMNDQQIAFTSNAGTWIYELGQPPVPLRLMSPPDDEVFASPNSNWVMTYTDPNNRGYVPLASHRLSAWSMSGEAHQLLSVSHALGSETSPVLHWFGVVGSYIVASQGAVVYVWPDDFSGEPQLFEQPASDRTEYVIELADLSSDGKTLATAARAILSDQLIISVWDTQTGEQQVLYQDEYLPLERLWIQDLQFSGDSRELAAFMNGGAVWHWDVVTSQQNDPTERQCEDPTSSSFTLPYLDYTGNLFICLFHSPNGMSPMQMHELDTSTLLSELDINGHDMSYAVTPDLQYLAVANQRSYTNRADDLMRYRIVVWDIAQNELFAEFVGFIDAITALEFSPNGEQLLGGSFDGMVRVWDMNTRTQTHLIEGGHSLPVTSLAFSPDGQWLISAATNPLPDSNYHGSSRGFVARWNLANGQFEKLVDGSNDRITSVVFSPDGQYLYLGDLEGRLHIWDGETLTPLETIFMGASIFDMTLNSDGQLLAIVNENHVSIWDTTSKNVVNQLRHTAPANYCSPHFTSDDGWLRLCGDLWKVENQGKLIAAWSPSNLPEELVDWYRATERNILFPSNDADGRAIYWRPRGFYENERLLKSLAITSSRDLVAAGLANGVINLYGIGSEG